MAVETTTTTDIYTSETSISAHTCRPLDESTRAVTPTFWCEPCSLKLKNVVSALRHLQGKNHKKQQQRLQQQSQQPPEIPKSPLKRKLTGPEEVLNGSRANGQALENGTPSKRSRLESRENGAQDVGIKLIRCDQCEKDFQTADLAVTHFKSRQHVSKIEAAVKQKLLTEIKCDSCDTQFNSVAMALSHYASRKHIKKVSAVLDKTPEPLSAPATTDPVSPDVAVKEESTVATGYSMELPLKCDLCVSSFTSPFQANQHFMGKKHLAKAKVLP